MFITSANPKKGMVVPEKSIVQTGNDAFVYVAVGNEDNGYRAQKRKVTLGETFDGNQVVLEGVEKGEKVMVGGLANLMLFDGAQLNLIAEK